MQAYRSVIVGVGSALPERVVSNEELSRTIETSDAWIRQRTGICQRYIAGEHETTSSLGVAAARAALEHADVSVETIDLIICATSTPDRTFPATAAMIQRELGITQGAAFDIQAVCTGFVYALHIANALIQSGQHLRVLVIGAETYSRILDWEDRTTSVLFGDGAGAAVLERQHIDPNSDMREQRGILASRIRSDGRYEDKLYVDGGPSLTQTSGHLRMKGRDVFKLAVGMVPAILDDVMTDAGIDFERIDWFVPHQANLRIIEATADKIGLSMDKVILTVQDHANTSSASIPLALTSGVNAQKIKKNDLVLLEAMGGGFTWGATLVRW